MANYQHILIAIDFSDHHLQVCNKAQELAQLHQAKLSICHIVENYIVSDFAYEAVNSVTLDMQDQLFDSAQKRINDLVNTFATPTQNQWVEFGSPRYDLVRLAEAHDVDLIVVGSHGRHGLQLLLGSTANAVLHHAKCDVLAIRLDE